MIGKVHFTLGGEPAEAVLGDDGVWTTPLEELTDDLNSDLSPRDGSPADGAFGYLQLHKAAERLRGVVEAPEPPESPPGLVY